MAGNVPLFNGLKRVACPKEAGGATCSTPGCLFGHRFDSQSQTDDVPAPGVFALDGAADLNEDSPPAKKRQKMNPTSHSQQEFTTKNRNSSHSSGNLPTFAKKVKHSDGYDPLSTAAVGQSPKAPPSTVTPSSLKATASTVPHARPFHSLPSLTQATKSATPYNLASSIRANTKHTSSFVPPTIPGKPMAAHSLASSLAPSSPGAKDGTSPERQQEPKRKNHTNTDLAKPPRKPETLNPRHIPSAPTSHSTRFQLLKLLYTELLRLNGEVATMSTKEPELKPLIKSDQELIWMALDIEEKVATEKGPIYRGVMSQTVVARRRMDAATYVTQCKQQLAQASLRGGAVSLGKKPSDGPPSARKPVVIETGLTLSQEIQVLERLITPITDLEQHGYISTPPTEHEIAKAAQAVEWSKNWEQCDRCNTRFQVFPDRNIETGELTSGGKCTHHPGRMYFPARVAGDTGYVNKKYRCCGQELNESPGCASVDGHVWKTSDTKRLAQLWNWVNTPANDSPDVHKVVAFDCEMGYTTKGMELLRVTATSWPDGADLLDVLVQPFGSILDLNSRWSGVLPEDLLRGVPWTKDWKAPAQEPGERKILAKVDSPKAARDLLFSITSPDSILVGHGLENDLNAMRIIHPKIVDTVLLYPHRKGLPLRNSLKGLMELHLRREIQIDTGSGHDSAEDARAAGDLVRLQIQNKWKFMKIDGWQFSGDVLCNPKKDGKEVRGVSSSSKETQDSEEGAAKLTVEKNSTKSETEGLVDSTAM